ncbi:4-phosphoerythronate dehydrogenase [Candidatus Blochmannia ocreatus (nom. nud.)]|uniref:Erythronate-4-phosphate dehydrogenase n=1 Tax=Candidatus Blochmannia ocreatus (nom. nud.) TaxID=251538 RepID=A0ABY4SUB8_9ENTR|nr:4-phosphoerythronate dehydrogenase [Candidatus Blochmannia ocreatus]URJ24984.1 4-phosphoerythronate dehydrogenase [Candidatus Blochmannia ocreatus]
MRILADKHIPYINRLFGLHNIVKLCEGRSISNRDVKDVDILIVRSITQVNEILLNNSAIKFIGTVTSGIDHVDCNYLKDCGINFVYTPGSNAVAVVEYVFAALFWLASRDNFFLRDKVIGIVGVGNIGSLLNKRLCSFGVQTLLCDPPLEKLNTSESWKSFEKLVSEVDILTLHTPLIMEGYYPTWHMVDFDVLDALPDNSILINTCRGAVIDNSALLKILKNGKKLNVVLDVWESEPIVSVPLLSYVDLGTPHIAGYTIESKIRSIMRVYNEYCNFFGFSDLETENISVLGRSIIHDIQVKEKLDEILLNRLIKLIYNINYDDNMLRNFANVLGGFDRIRSCYASRREWSSLCVKTCVDCIYEMLIKLGFSVV